MLKALTDTEKMFYYNILGKMTINMKTGKDIRAHFQFSDEK